MITPLNTHYSFENPASIYDEEALTALELAGRQGAKINEVINDQNKLRQETGEHLEQQDSTIEQRMTAQDNAIEKIRTVTVPADVKAECARLIASGEFDQAINLYLNNLNGRVDNLLGSVSQGSTTMDAEVIDTRVAHDGTIYDNAGSAVRAQIGEIMSGIDYIIPGMKSPGIIKLGNANATVSVKDGIATAQFTALDRLTEHCGVRHSLGNPVDVARKTFKITLTNKGDTIMPLHVMLVEGQNWAKPFIGENVIVVPGATETMYLTVNADSVADPNFIMRYFPREDNHDIYSVGGTIEYTVTRVREAGNTPYLSRIYAPSGTPLGTIDVTKRDGVYHIEQGQINNPENVWQYYLISVYLGRVNELRGKLLHSVNYDISYACFSTSDAAWQYKVMCRGENYIDADAVIDELATQTTVTDTTRIFMFIGMENKTAVFEPHTINLCCEVLPKEFNTANRMTPDLWEDVNQKITQEAEKAVADAVELSSPTGITCWGDSLTAQAGWTTVLGNLSGMVVQNCGVGGEPSNTIMARQGADAMMVNNVTIPADIIPVELATYNTPFTTALGKSVRPLLQGPGGMNPVTIAGVEGTLAFTGTSYNDSTGQYLFTRSQAGSAVTVNRPTTIVTNADKNHNSPYLMVIYMGQNDGNFDISELIQKHKLMIAHAKANNIIVLGLSSGTATQRAEYETAMQAEFGRHFISLRQYLSVYGLSDAGLTPTEEDKTAMNEGRTPPQLLKDSVHYTDACKTVIGNYVYKQCCELNIF